MKLSQIVRAGVAGLCLSLGACAQRHIDYFPPHEQSQTEEPEWSKLYQSARNTRILFLADNALYVTNALGQDVEKGMEGVETASLALFPSNTTAIAVQDKSKNGYGTLRMLAESFETGQSRKFSSSKAAFEQEYKLIGWTREGRLCYRERVNSEKDNVCSYLKLAPVPDDSPKKHAIIGSDWLTRVCDNYILTWPRKITWGYKDRDGAFPRTDLYVIDTKLNKITRCYARYYESSPQKDPGNSAMSKDDNHGGYLSGEFIENVILKNGILAFITSNGDTAELHATKFEPGEHFFIKRTGYERLALGKAKSSLIKYSINTWTPKPELPINMWSDPEMSYSLDYSPENNMLLCIGVHKDQDGDKEQVLFAVSMSEDSKKTHQIYSTKSEIKDARWICEGKAVLFQEGKNIYMASRYGRHQMPINLPGLEDKVTRLCDIVEVKQQ
jgi:hypothetical protein